MILLCQLRDHEEEGPSNAVGSHLLRLDVSELQSLQRAPCWRSHLLQTQQHSSIFNTKEPCKRSQCVTPVSQGTWIVSLVSADCTVQWPGEQLQSDPFFLLTSSGSQETAWIFSSSEGRVEECFCREFFALPFKWRWFPCSFLHLPYLKVPIE